VKIQFETWYLLAFSVSFLRAWGFILIAPPFANQSLPGRVRVALSVVFAFAGTKQSAVEGITTSGDFIGALVVNLLLGFVLGFLLYMLFAAIGIAGELIDGAIGYSSAQALDPTTGLNAGLVSRMYNLVAATLLFASGGYVFIVRGFVRSGDVLTTIDSKNLAQTALATMAVMMVAAFEIALPVVAALLCAEIALALLGKAAPQLNVFQLGFAVKIFIGLSLLGVVVVALPSQTEALLNKFLEMMGA